MLHSEIPTLSQIVAHYAALDASEGQSLTSDSTNGGTAKAEREWSAAIAALQNLLVQQLGVADGPEPYQGVVLAGPNPVIEEATLLQKLHIGLFRPQPLEAIAVQHFQLPAAQDQSPASNCCPSTHQDYPLVPHDPLAYEQFCLVLTANMSLVVVLAADAQGQLTFDFTFDPDAILHCWQALRARLYFTNLHRLAQLEPLVTQLTPSTPDYRLVTAFSRQLLQQLPTSTATQLPTVPVPTPPTVVATDPENGEFELLQALTHEVRTPLTTIRMLTRLLLKKRKTFAQDVIKRLETIDQECTDQINRMELIFRAAELETHPPAGDRPSAAEQYRGQLIPLALQQVIQQHIEQWEKQAQRRHINLDIVLPSHLPTIVSHPALLTQVLTGLMERLTRSLPAGSTVQMHVTTAGNQLKLQFLSQDVALSTSLKSLGQLLMFQPETGCLSLNLDVTKNLFQTLGGKLTVRQRSHQGEELTIFLPLDTYQLSA